MNIEERMLFFQEILTSVHPIYFTAFNANYDPIYCSAPNPGLLYTYFALDQLADALDFNQIVADHQKTTLDFPATGPKISTNSLDMIWLSDAYYENGKIHSLYVIGPVFADTYVLQRISQKLDTMHISLIAKKQFLNFLQSLPIIPYATLMEYGVMLHRVLTGSQIRISDITYHKSANDSSQTTAPTIAKHIQNRHGLYVAESALLQAVTDGNTHYKESIDHLRSFSVEGQLIGNTYLQKAKTAGTVLVSLVCRAAIKGGLSPEIAYGLSDNYLSDITSSDKVEVISSLLDTMLDDYVHRVHRLKNNSSQSPQIQSVCDQIRMNLCATHEVHQYAEKLHYSDYYFTKRFHEETGKTLKQFSTEVRLEHAKLLLQNPELSISDIADMLHFCSQSYFGKQFTQYTGQTPAEYRKSVSA